MLGIVISIGISDALRNTVEYNPKVSHRREA